MIEQADRFRGMMVGTAVGDALGLPMEGLGRRRASRMFPGPWRHRLVLGRGMVSDDTEHTVFAAQCLLAHAASPERFARRLGWCLRLWLLTLPAGVGLGTARAVIRLWCGFPPGKSGVRSAGNGPAMRAAPIGAFFSDAPEQMDRFVSGCTRLTHTDPRAETGARAIAGVAAWIVRDGVAGEPDREGFVTLLRAAGEDEEWQRLVREIDDGLAAGLSVADFACKLGLTDHVSGFMYHTVPVVLYAWFRHCGSFSDTLSAVLECGGDTDTTGAIAGALAGLTVGESGIPDEWIDGIIDWPRSVRVLERLGDALAVCKAGSGQNGPVGYFWPGVIIRNALFLGVVLLHGFRRLLPPY